MDFNLKYGMKDEEFLNEVRGRIHGEYRTQIQAILKTQKQMAMEEGSYNREKDKYENEHINALSHDFMVDSIDSRKRLALVMKRWLSYSWRNTPFTYEYYMVGMNSDDRSYFIHPMHGYDRNQREEISWIDWVNRKNSWGFKDSDRVQGDILLRLIKLEESYERTNGRGSSILNRILGEKYYFINMEPSYFSPIKYIWRFRVRNGKAIYSPGEYENIIVDNKLSSGISSNNNRFGLGNYIFNHHRLLHDGDPYHCIIRNHGREPEYPVYVVLNSSYVTLEHDEHPRYTTNVPLGHAVLITAQRGQVQYARPENMVD